MGKLAIPSPQLFCRDDFFRSGNLEIDPFVSKSCAAIVVPFFQLFHHHLHTFVNSGAIIFVLHQNEGAIGKSRCPRDFPRAKQISELFAFKLNQATAQLWSIGTRKGCAVKWQTLYDRWLMTLANLGRFSWSIVALDEASFPRPGCWIMFFYQDASFHWPRCWIITWHSSN